MINIYVDSAYILVWVVLLSIITTSFFQDQRWKRRCQDFSTPSQSV